MGPVFNPRPIDQITRENHFKAVISGVLNRAAEEEGPGQGQAALRWIRDLRHTYATLRISKGDSITDVSAQLGHHSIKFTLDQYYHWMPGEAKGEVDGLDNPQPNATYTQPNEVKGPRHMT